MTLDTIYNKWLAIQPLTEAEQNMLSMRFTEVSKAYGRAWLYNTQ